MLTKEFKLLFFGDFDLKTIRNVNEQIEIKNWFCPSKRLQTASPLCSPRDLRLCPQRVKFSLIYCMIFYIRKSLIYCP